MHHVRDNLTTECLILSTFLRWDILLRTWWHWPESTWHKSWGGPQMLLGRQAVKNSNTARAIALGGQRGGKSYGYNRGTRRRAGKLQSQLFGWQSGCKVSARLQGNQTGSLGACWIEHEATKCKRRTGFKECPRSCLRRKDKCPMYITEQHTSNF